MKDASDADVQSRSIRREAVSYGSLPKWPLIMTGQKYYGTCVQRMAEERSISVRNDDAVRNETSMVNAIQAVPYLCFDHCREVASRVKTSSLVYW